MLLKCGAHHNHQIDRPITYDLVADVHVTAPDPSDVMELPSTTG